MLLFVCYYNVDNGIFPYTNWINCHLRLIYSNTLLLNDVFCLILLKILLQKFEQAKF